MRCLTVTLDKWRPLAARAEVPELIVQQGYAFAYESAKAFADDALGRELRRCARRAGSTCSRVRDIRAFDAALSPRLTHLVVLPEQGHCPEPAAAFARARRPPARRRRAAS